MAAKKKSVRSRGARKSNRKSPRKSAARKGATRRSNPGFTSVSGPFNGTINTPGVLHIATGGSFNATIDAGAVQVDGAFKGRLNAKGDVLISKGAKANGAFTASRILIEEGADFNGRCRVSARRAA